MPYALASSWPGPALPTQTRGARAQRIASLAYTATSSIAVGNWLSRARRRWTGWLEGQARAMSYAIRADARADDAKWKIGDLEVGVSKPLPARLINPAAVTWFRRPRS